MNKDIKLNIFFTVLIFIAVVFFLWQYVFQIYEVRFQLNSDVYFANEASEIKIVAVPLNSFGYKAPFRKVKTEYRIEKGKDLVKVLLIDNKNGILILQTTLLSGEVEVIATTNKTIFPNIIRIKINPNLT